MPATSPLHLEFFDRGVVSVARALLGKTIVRETTEGRASGRIVETEAYRSTNDPACHAARSRTRRNASMFGPPGRAYVYAIHAKYCFNVVTEAEGAPSAVLIRGVEPLAGIELMRQRRGKQKLVDLTRGPARLCQAFRLTTDDDGWDLTQGEQLWIEDDPQFSIQSSAIGESVRIGVTSGEDLKLRFFLRDNLFVSGPRWLNNA